MAESDGPEAQWPVILDQKCELCDINPITFKCLNCDEIVCDNCKKAHLRSKLTKDHKVVCLRSAEIYKSTEASKKCPSHTSEDLLMFCNTCNCPICRECVTSGVHLHHTMVKVEEVIDSKEKELSNIIEQANEKSKKYKNAITAVTQNKLEFSMSIAKKIEMVKSRNTELKIKLDNIESDYIKELQNVDKENKKALTKLEQKLQGEMSDLNNLIQQCVCKKMNRNIEMIRFVTDITQRLDIYKSWKPPDVACPPHLITKQVDDQEVKNLFGYLDKNKTPDVSRPLTANRKNPSPNTAEDVKILSSFPCEMSHVVTKSNSQAWLWSWRYKGISLVTSAGKVIQDINTDFKVYDAAVTTTGDILVTVNWGNKVKELTRNNKFTDIYTADGYITRGITVTDTENVLVGLYKIRDSKIVEITTSGQHIKTIQHDTVDNKPLFNGSLSICTNINGDIIVADLGKVVAVNKSGTKRFIYDGTYSNLPNSFGPHTVVTDKHGQIIISDFHNHVLHVLDRNGKLIQYLTKREHGCDRPAGIAIDSSGILWVCDTGKKVSIIKYI